MPQSFAVAERVEEIRTALHSLTSVSITDLSETEQDFLWFLSAEYYGLVGHDFCVEPTQEASNG